MNIRECDEAVKNELKGIFEYMDKDPEIFRERFLKYTKQQQIDADGLRLFTIWWLKNYFRQTEKKYSEYLDIDIQEIRMIEDLADYVIQVCASELKYRAEIKKAIRIINEEYHTRLQLSDVAYRIGLSTQYFSRLFREETGKNYSDYLISVRMERAQELLMEGRFKVYEVAELVGISN